MQQFADLHLPDCCDKTSVELNLGIPIFGALLYHAGNGSLLVLMGFSTTPIIPQRAVFYDVKSEIGSLGTIYFSMGLASKAYGKFEYLIRIQKRKKKKY